MPWLPSCARCRRHHRRRRRRPHRPPPPAPPSGVASLAADRHPWRTVRTSSCSPFPPDGAPPSPSCGSLQQKHHPRRPRGISAGPCICWPARWGRARTWVRRSTWPAACGSITASSGVARAPRAQGGHTGAFCTLRGSPEHAPRSSSSGGGSLRRGDSGRAQRRASPPNGHAPREVTRARCVALLRSDACDAWRG